MNNNDFMGMYVTIASMHLRRNLDARFDLEVHTSGIQGRILAQLVRSEEEGKVIYQKDVGELFGIQRSSVNSLVTGLESRGYIERLPDETDARLKRLILTECGRQQHRKICHIIDDFEQELASCFTTEEKEQVISMMQRIIKHFSPDCGHADDRKEPEHD